jgi:hypothetical protein
MTAQALSLDGRFRGINGEPYSNDPGTYPEITRVSYRSEKERISD